MPPETAPSPRTGPTSRSSRGNGPPNRKGPEMSKLKSRLTIASLGAAAALLLLPAAGQAATEFGSRLNHDPANSGECESLPPLDEPGACSIVSLVEPEGA